jgi:hypothetical protein
MIPVACLFLGLALFAWSPKFRKLVFVAALLAAAILLWHARP